MPLCEVLSALKLGGVRHVPGTVLDLTDAQVASLSGVVRVRVATSSPVVRPRVERSPEERAEAVRVAQSRVAHVMGQG
jgi:hypothetical protein